jgi:ankyrin repeat protein
MNPVSQAVQAPGGWTLLHAAALHMHCIEAFTTLLEFGADIQKGNEESHTALPFAAESGQMEIVRLIILEQMEIVRLIILEHWPEGLGVANEDLVRPLHCAAAQRLTEVVNLSLERWPEGLRAINKHLDTPLDVAAKFKRTEVVELLKSWGW